MVDTDTKVKDIAAYMGVSSSYINSFIGLNKRRPLSDDLLESFFQYFKVIKKYDLNPRARVYASINSGKIKLPETMPDEMKLCLTHLATIELSVEQCQKFQKLLKLDSKLPGWSDCGEDY